MACRGKGRNADDAARNLAPTEQFIEFYYNTFDADRKGLASLYVCVPTPLPFPVAVPPGAQSLGFGLRLRGSSELLRINCAPCLLLFFFYRKVPSFHGLANVWAVTK